VLREPDRSLFLTALGATMVSYSNYTYEPSLSSRPGAGKPLIENASVGFAVCQKLSEMLEDISWAQDNFARSWVPRRRDVYRGSYFDSELPARSVSLLLTSPPYMNNYHYVRNTRPQLYWLGLVAHGGELRQLEDESFGKFWQTVRQRPPVKLAFEFPELAAAIERLRELHPDKGYYGGSGWANYVATYFNDSNRFLKQLRLHLKPGGYAVIVVGNSILQGINIEVQNILADIARMHGLHVEGIHRLRDKRVGDSITASSIRNGAGKAVLDESAVVIRKR
jgi:hypothetical protein